MTDEPRWVLIKVQRDTYASHGVLIEGPRAEDVQVADEQWARREGAREERERIEKRVRNLGENFENGHYETAIEQVADYIASLGSEEGDSD
jgi:hypothetical protein